MTDNIKVTVADVVEAISGSAEPTVGMCEADIFNHVWGKFVSEEPNARSIIDKLTLKSIKMGLEYEIIEKRNNLYRLPPMYYSRTQNLTSGKSKSITGTQKSVDKKSPKQSQSRKSTEAKKELKIETIFKREDKPKIRKRKHSSSSAERKKPRRSTSKEPEGKHKRASSTERPANKKPGERTCASESALRTASRRREHLDTCSGFVPAADKDKEQCEEMDDEVCSFRSGSSQGDRRAGFSSSSSSSDLVYLPEEGDERVQGVNGPRHQGGNNDEYQKQDGDEDGCEDQEGDGDEDEEGVGEEEDDSYEPCNCVNCKRSEAYNRSFYKTDEYRKSIEYVECSDEDLERTRLLNKQLREERERRIAKKRDMRQQSTDNHRAESENDSEMEDITDSTMNSESEDEEVDAWSSSCTDFEDYENDSIFDDDFSGDECEDERVMREVINTCIVSDDTKEKSDSGKNRNRSKNEMVSNANVAKGKRNKSINKDVKNDDESDSSNTNNHTECKSLARHIFKYFDLSFWKKVANSSSESKNIEYDLTRGEPLNPHLHECLSSGVPPSTAQDREIIGKYVNGYINEKGTLVSIDNQRRRSDNVECGDDVVDSSNSSSGGDNANRADREDETLDEDDSLDGIPKNVDVCEQRFLLNKRDKK